MNDIGAIGFEENEIIDEIGREQSLHVCYFKDHEMYTKSKQKFKVILLNYETNIIPGDYEQAFVIVFGKGADCDLKRRIELFKTKINMISENKDDVKNALKHINTLGETPGNIQCLFCKNNTLSKETFADHILLYHCAERAPGAAMGAQRFDCPLCPGRIRGITPQQHVKKVHHHRATENPRFTPQMVAFSLVICQREIDGKFLLVHETGGRGYWLPGGGVDENESLEEAAIRETKEEAGIDIDLTGVLNLQYSPQGGFCRLRAIFLAKPKPFSTTKTIPDYESVGSCWVSVDEINDVNLQRHLRGSEPIKWFNYVAQGKPIHDLSVLGKE